MNQQQRRRRVSEIRRAQEVRRRGSQETEPDLRTIRDEAIAIQKMQAQATAQNIERGSARVLLIVVALVVGLVGFGVWWIYSLGRPA